MASCGYSKYVGGDCTLAIVVHVWKAQLANSVLELPNALRTSKATAEHASWQTTSSTCRL